MKLILSSALFLVSMMLQIQAQAAVWVETNRWDARWEQLFSNWIHTSFTDDIFTNGRYKGIPTDCADAVYLSRAIFAFENKLPFVILDPTGGGAKISNRMGRFDGSGNELTRFRQFAQYIGDMTSTQTLANDSYPIAIRREFVRPGTIWSRPRIKQENILNMIFGGRVQEDPGHAEVVIDVTETGAIQVMGSTVPKAVRKLISTSSLVFMPVEKTTGLRNWILPENYGKPVAQYPGYSMEQFQLGEGKAATGESGGTTSTPRSLSAWQEDVQGRLQLRAENKDEALFRAAGNLCSLVNARVDAVNKGLIRQRALGGACMNAGDYDSYSTPSRDKRILTTIEEMVSLGGGFGFTTAGRVDKVAKYLSKCPDVKIASNQTMSLHQIAKAYAEGRVSSNPNDKLELRWGLGSNSESNPKNCTVY